MARRTEDSIRRKGYYIILINNCVALYLIHFVNIWLDADEEKKKEELRLVAKSELEEWYKIHKEQIAKTKDVNR